MEFRSKEEFESKIKRVVVTEDEIRAKIAEAGRYMRL